MRSLTYIHECAHLAQFVSCSYGLRVLRYTNICLRYVMKMHGIKLPLLDFLLKSENLKETESTAIDRFLVFWDINQQLALNTKLEIQDNSSANSGEFLVKWRLWSPHFYLFDSSSLNISEMEFARIVEENSSYVRKIPYITTQFGRIHSRLEVNVASLMEVYAVMVELNHLINATNGDIVDLMKLTPKSFGYYENFFFLLQHTKDIYTSLIILTACVDIALMYDPFILFNTTLMLKPEDKNHYDIYPGETFIRACEAAKELPVPKDGYEHYRNYHNELCAKMNIPSPQWMAEKAYKVICSLMRNLDIEQTILGRAYEFHKNALKLRCDDAALFPFILPITNLMRIVEMGSKCVTFYNINTQQPLSSYEDRLDVIQMYDLLVQVLFSQDVVCSLKQGKPFYCDKSDDADNILCGFITPDQKLHECKADIFDRLILWDQK